jgi:hypothetical protein
MNTTSRADKGLAKKYLRSRLEGLESAQGDIPEKGERIAFKGNLARSGLPCCRLPKRKARSMAQAFEIFSKMVLTDNEEAVSAYVRRLLARRRIRPNKGHHTPLLKYKKESRNETFRCNACL